MTDISPTTETNPAPSLTPPPEPAPAASLLGNAGLDTQPAAPAESTAAASDTIGSDTSGGDTTPAPGTDTLTGDSTEPAAPELTLDSYNFITPDGFTPDDALVAKFKEHALADKLDPASAQKFIDLYVESQQALVTKIQSDYQDLQATWLRQIEATPDFATQARKEASLTAIGRFIDEYGTPEVRQAFDNSGAGNNPSVVAFLLKAAKALSEGGPVRPGGPAAQHRNLTPGHALYGNKYDQPQ